MKHILSTANTIFALFSMLLVVISTILVASGAESTGVFDLYVLSLLQITAAGLVAAIVCTQWFLGDKAPRITRALSVAVLALVPAFVVFFAVSSADVAGGANIGLGLLGMAISYLGFANALAVVIPRLRLTARQ